jgi:opacity protein-like surface antigen
MKHYRRNLWSAALALVAVLAASTAFAADVTGTWAMTVETQAGAGNPTLTLTQKGETVTGTYKGQLGEAPVNGTIKGDDFSLKIKVNAQGQDLEIEYTGKVDGASMSGKVVLGTFGEGTFTGKKQ